MSDRQNVQPVGAPKVCLDCQLSPYRQCRYHSGETWRFRPPEVDPATAVALRRAQAERHRGRQRRVWAWAVLILAGNFGLLLLGAIR